MDKLMSLGFSDRSVRSLVSTKRSANRRVQTKNDFTFWLIFGLSPNLGLSESLGERLMQKLKRPDVYQFCTEQFVCIIYVYICL